MPGFDPVGATPVGAIGSTGGPPPPSPGDLRASEQAAYVALAGSGEEVTEQSAQVALVQDPGVYIPGQAAYVALVFGIPGDMEVSEQAAYVALVPDRALRRRSYFVPA